MMADTQLYTYKFAIVTSLSGRHNLAGFGTTGKSTSNLGSLIILPGWGKRKHSEYMETSYMSHFLKNLILMFS